MPKMNKIILLVFTCFSLLFVACEEEAALSPSNLEINRLDTLVDLSKPLVKEYYEDYNRAILYDFNDTLDFIFHLGRNYMARNWSQLTLIKLKPEQVDSALSYLDTTLFSYFKNEINFNGKTYRSTQIKQWLPRTMLVYHTIENRGAASTSIPYPLMSESDDAPYNTSGVLHTLYNDNGFAFAVNPAKYAASAITANEIRNDNFYQVLCYVLERRDLYDSISEAFRQISVSYYGRNMVDVYLEDGYELHETSRKLFLAYGETGYKDSTIIWLSEKGFVFTDNMKLGSSHYGSDGYLLDTDVFWTYQEDVRTYVNEIIFGVEEELVLYAEPTKEKLRILIETFMEWGVDVVAFNPALNVLYNE